MENKEEITVIKNEDGTIKTIKKSGNLTTTTVTNKNGKVMSFSAMIVGQGKACFTDKITKEMLSKVQIIEQEQKTEIKNIENSVTILSSEKNTTKTKNHFKKQKTKRTKQNLFYKNDNENTR